MEREIGSLYQRLKSKVSVDRLKEISSEIIHAYKIKNFPLLQRYASYLGLDVSSMRKNRLFSRLIQTYHPDKFNLINDEIDSCFKKNDIEALKHYERVFMFEWGSSPILVEYSEVYDIDTEDFDRFGMGIVDISIFDTRIVDEYLHYDEQDDQERSEEIDIFDALQRELCGGLAYTLSQFDLNSLEGDLDLSDYGISNIEGIEHCVNIASLNLSGNRIFDINPLASLTNLESLFLSENRIRDINSLSALTGLRELDVSFNDIEKADVLLSIDTLKYVNLAGNRIKNEEVTERLRNRNAIVID
jgi:hypothetical protein